MAAAAVISGSERVLQAAEAAAVETAVLTVKTLHTARSLYTITAKNIGNCRKELLAPVAVAAMAAALPELTAVSETSRALPAEAAAAIAAALG